MPFVQVQLDAEVFGRDIVPEWESSFGIRFARNDFAQATTVGDIWSVVERHLVALIGENPEELTTVCATQRTFYQLRRALMAQGWARAEVVPQAQLQVLFPWRQRRRLGANCGKPPRCPCRGYGCRRYFFSHAGL